MERKAIEDILAPIKGVTFASLDTQTEVKLTGGKSNPHQGRIVKRCLGNRVMLFTNQKASGYENKVKKHLAKAGLDPDTFNAGRLPWGERIPNTPFIECKGKLYLQCVFIKAGDVKYFIKNEAPLEGFSGIHKNNIIGLSEKTGSEHQGLEKSEQVIVRTYAIDSLMAIRCFKDELENDEAEDVGLWSEIDHAWAE